MKITAETHVLVRALTGDDARQSTGPGDASSPFAKCDFCATVSAPEAEFDLRKVTSSPGCSRSSLSSFCGLVHRRHGASDRVEFVLRNATLLPQHRLSAR